MDTIPARRVFAVAARYHDQEIREHRGNPAIEALPRMLSREDVRRTMELYPDYTPADRMLPAFVREQSVSGLDRICHPLGLHVEFESRLSRLMRWGYVPRNPVSPAFQREVKGRLATLNDPRRPAALDGPVPMGLSTYEDSGLQQALTPKGLTLLGVSGVGKSRMVEMALARYPQVIVHSEYAGRPFTGTQIAHLRLQCPRDGSILTLCSNFFAEIDRLHQAIGIETRYRAEYVKERSAISRLMVDMANLAAQHHLGLLVLDELQDLNPRGSRAMLSYLVQLVNTMGVPVVMVGGVDAYDVLKEQFRQARRGATEGGMILGRGEPGAQWRALCEAVWRFQYTREETPLTPELADLLYQESQGITDYMVRLCKLAQVSAIANGTERITPSIIRGVARTGLAEAQRVLKALRSGTAKDIAYLRGEGDVLPPEGIEVIPFVRGDAPQRPLPSSGRQVAAAPTDDQALPRNPALATPSGAKKPRRKKPASGLLPGIGRTRPKHGVYDALVEEGVIRGALWARVAGPEAMG